MKKLFVMAMMCIASGAAFAGDSPELKAILKAKTYDEAASLVKAANLPNAEEKAKAYNKLVDLAMSKVTKETGTIAENQLAEQMKTGKVEQYDTLGLADAICNAINDAIECNKYDQEPNAKGKVAPKFAEKNAQRIWSVRTHLVNIGQDVSRSGNDAAVLKYWGAFLDSSADPLFASQEHESQKAYFGQVAFFAGRYAAQAKDMTRANKYLDMAMEDPEQKTEALNLKLYLGRSELKTKQDSLQYIETLKDLYVKNPENAVVLDGLYIMYGEMKDRKAQDALLDNHLAKYPNDFTALADKGMLLAIDDNDPKAGAEWLRKAIAVNDKNAVVQYYLGTCLIVQAGNTEDVNARKALFQEAVKALDAAKEIDPDKAQVRWGYNRYQAYYGLYGADDPKTKAAEAEAK